MSQDPYDDIAPARSRRRRSIITFAIVLLMLFFAVWYALSYIRADGAQAGRTSSSTTHSSPSTCGISPKQVEVNVYNATNRDGLAGRVATQLTARGFTVKTVANDPKKVKIDGAGVLRYGSGGRNEAKLVGLHTGKLEMLQDARKRTTVDVVLGPTFKKLVPEADVQPC